MADLSRSLGRRARLHARHRRSGQRVGRHRVAPGRRATARPRARDARRAHTARAACAKADGRTRPALPAGTAAIRVLCDPVRAPDGAPPARLGRTRSPASIQDRPGRISSVFRYAILQVRMFRDLDAGIMHATIFWGFVILTVGTADRVTFGLVHTIVGPSSTAGYGGCCCWRQNLFVLGVLRDDRLRALPQARVAPSPAHDAVTRLADHPVPHRRRRAVGVVRRGLPHRRLRRPRCGMGGHGLRRCHWSWARSSGDRAPGRLRALLLGQRRGLVSFFLVYLPGSKHLHIVTAFFNAALRKMQSARRAAGDGSRGGGCPLRHQDHRGHVAGRTSSTASRAPSAAAARRPVRPGRRASRSTPRR